MAFLNLANEVFNLCNNHSKCKRNYYCKFANTMILIGVKAGNVTCKRCKSWWLRKVVALYHRMWEMKGVVLREAIFQSMCFQFKTIVLSGI